MLTCCNGLYLSDIDLLAKSSLNLGIFAPVNYVMTTKFVLKSMTNFFHLVGNPCKWL